MKWVWWLVIGGGVVAFLLAPGALTDKLMAVAAGVCPQRPSHSHIVGGWQLPMEARMMGIFAGFGVTVLYVIMFGRGRATAVPGGWWRAGLLGLVAVMALDGLNAFAHDIDAGAFYAPDNGVRLATGLLAGGAAALLFLPVCNAAVWRDGEHGAALSQPIATGRLLALGAGLWLSSVAGWAWAYYPLALLAIGGLVLAVGMLDLLLVLALGRRNRSVGDVADLLPYGALALCLAAGELAGLAALRYSALERFLQ